MGREVVYCEVCGIRILQAEFEQGKAVAIQGKIFCAGCAKDKGLRQEVTAPPTPPPRRSPLAPPARKSRTASTRRIHVLKTPPPRKGKSLNVPMIVGAVVVGLALVLLLIVVMSGGGDSDRQPDPGEVREGPGDPNKGPDPDGGRKEREERADRIKTAFEDLKRFAAEHKDDPAAVVERCNGDLAVLEKTDYEDAVLEIKREAEARINLEKSVRMIQEFLDGAEAIWNDDPDFRRRKEVERRFREARRMAEKFAPDKLKEIEGVEKRFRLALEQAAERVSGEAIRRAVELETRQRYDDAIGELDGFPDAFGDTAAKKKLDEVRARIEGKIADLVNAPNIVEEFRRATAMLVQNDDYQGGTDVYLKVFEMMKNRALVRFQGITEEQLVQIRQIGHYNVACFYSRDAKDAENACKHLELCFEAGWAQWDHLEADEDLKNIRDTARFKDLVAKYKGGE